MNRVNGHGRAMTHEQVEAVDLIVAQHVGQCTSNPDDELELISADWSAEAKQEAKERLDEGVFYCEGCSWYCDPDERHEGDLCDDCYDEEHKYDDAPEEE